MAEVVKTGLLAGEPLWELAGRRARPPLRRVQGRRLPARPARPRRAERCSTSATRSRTRSRRRPATRAARTAQAVALGLLAALRLSGRGHGRRSSEVLAPAAGRGSTATAPGQALARDKKAAAARPARPARGARRARVRRRACPTSDVRARARRADRWTSIAAVRVDVLNGVNLDVLGRRDPARLRRPDARASSRRRIYAWAKRARAAPSGAARRTTRASTSSGCHEALDMRRRRRRQPRRVDALQLGDPRRARAARRMPVVEVHLSNVDEREEWRRVLGHLRPRRARGSSARAPTATARRSSS